MSDRLIEGDRNAALAPLLVAGWQLVEGRDAIQKTFKFKNFAEAFGWMSQIAIRADQVAGQGAFGAVPVFAGTLLIAAIAMAVGCETVSLFTREPSRINVPSGSYSFTL